MCRCLYRSWEVSACAAESECMCAWGAACQLQVSGYDCESFADVFGSLHLCPCVHTTLTMLGGSEGESVYVTYSCLLGAQMSCLICA